MAEVKPGSVVSIVALANRLTRLKRSPGFGDLMQLAQMLEAEATAAVVTYEGWDAQQIVLLKARAQAAKEFREQMFARIDAAIENGRPLPGYEADTLRPPDPIEEMRIAGSYVPQ